MSVWKQRLYTEAVYGSCQACWGKNDIHVQCSSSSIIVKGLLHVRLLGGGGREREGRVGVGNKFCVHILGSFRREITSCRWIDRYIDKLFLAIISGGSLLTV